MEETNLMFIALLLLQDELLFKSQNNPVLNTYPAPNV